MGVFLPLELGKLIYGGFNPYGTSKDGGNWYAITNIKTESGCNTTISIHRLIMDATWLIALVRALPRLLMP